MCGIAGYSLRSRSSHWADAGCAGTSGSDRRARRRRRRLCLPRPGRHVRDRGQAAHARLTTPRTSVRARRGEPAARPRARLHEGPSVDLRQQPPGAPRAGRRDPQRDHPERRRAARPPLLRPCRAAHDRRLGGDLRDRSALPERPARARAPARRDGDLLARRARAGRRLRGPRHRPPAVGRRGPRRRLLRLHEGCARGRRALLQPQAAQARAARGHVAGARGRTGRPPRPLPARRLLPRGRSRSRPCGHRRSGSSASAARGSLGRTPSL